MALLYFGYTKCPDICPTTLANLAEMLKGLGPDAADVRILFVTVDPNRDTLDVLRPYVKAFAPQMDGLRGPDNQIASLAHAYHVAFSVTPASNGHPYTVTHSSAVFFFDKKGNARLVSLTAATPDFNAKDMDEDIERLIHD